MKKIDGGVTAAKGFMASGIYAGIKKKRKDMSLVYSTVPAKGCGTFTTNIVKAAPVKWDIKLTKESEYLQAVILNSGIANACTGKQGEEDNLVMAQAAADALSIPVTSTYTASTGIIGKFLPMDKINEGVKLLTNSLSEDNSSGTLAAEAIMTTDTYSKECAYSFIVGGKEVKIGGMAKGSGMIHPNMATLLGVVTTDLAISKELLQESLCENVKNTYNMISIDRDTSTNDSVLILANGLAGNEEICEKNEDYYVFCQALDHVNKNLAKKIAGDGEGASKLLEVTVNNAKNKEEAILLSKSIICSNLVKTAVFGNDANWGRILCAMGYAQVNFDPDVVDLYIESVVGKLKLVENGMATSYCEKLATKILSAREVKAIADMKRGIESATAWGCDLTYDYIKINADYRS